MKLYPNISLIFIIWCVSLSFISYFGFLSFPHSLRFDGNLFESLANWDGGHFLGIAEFGYREDFQYAFFPLYPLLIRALNQITQNYLIAALLISVGSSFLAINLLYKLVLKDFGRIIAEKAIWALFIFPTSFYFLTAYSEGLFLLSVVATFYFARRNLFLATLFAAAASATRLVGLALVFGLIVEVWSTSGINKKTWYVLFAPAGFVAYCFFLYIQTADPFYFVTAQAHWLRSLSIPGVGFWEAIKGITGGSLLRQNFNALLDLAFTIFGAGMILRAFRFLPISYSIYGLVSIALPLLTPSLSSMPRFLLPIFPIFILLALIKNQYAIFAYQLISIMLLSAFVTLFVNGYWVS